MWDYDGWEWHGLGGGQIVGIGGRTCREAVLGEGAGDGREGGSG